MKIDSLKLLVVLAVAAFPLEARGASGRPEPSASVLVLSEIRLDHPVPDAFDSSVRVVVDREKKTLLVQGSVESLAAWAKAFPDAKQRIVGPADDSNDAFLAMAQKLLERSSLDAPGIGVLLRMSSSTAAPARNWAAVPRSGASPSISSAFRGFPASR